jgi:hypothetical protein
MNHAPTRRPPRSLSDTIQAVLVVLLAVIVFLLLQGKV